MTAGPVIKPRTLTLPQFLPATAAKGTQVPLDPAPPPQGQPAPGGTPRSLQLPLEAEMAPTESPETLPLTPPSRPRPSLNHHRNAANATTALEILAQVSEAIATWHRELRQVIEQMQQVYRGGPVVDGWLEAMGSSQGRQDIPQEQRAFWRHGDPAQLNQYLETCWGQSGTLEPVPGAVESATTGPSQYRLCYLDGEGKVQCQPCPPAQLGVISQGIARYQQLRQLEQRKQWLEEKLRQSAIALGTTRDRLGLTLPANP